jgi:hypothetical protein
METSVLLYAGIVLLFFLASAVFFLALVYRRLITQLEQARDNSGKINDKAQEVSEKIIEQAKEKSLKLLESAEKKASEIIEQTHFVSEDARKDLTLRLEEASQKQTQEYAKMLTEVRTEIVALFTGISKTMQQQTSQELASFHQVVESSLQESLQALTTQSKTEIGKQNEAIEAYKAEKLRQVDETIFQLTKDVIVRVTSKSLTKAEHEALVLKALDQAKAEHVL